MHPELGGVGGAPGDHRGFEGCVSPDTPPLGFPLHVTSESRWKPFPDSSREGSLLAEIPVFIPVNVTTRKLMGATGVQKNDGRALNTTLSFVNAVFSLPRVLWCKQSVPHSDICRPFVVLAQSQRKNRRSPLCSLLKVGQHPLGNNTPTVL